METIALLPLGLVITILLIFVFEGIKQLWLRNQRNLETIDAVSIEEWQYAIRTLRDISRRISQ